MHGQHPNTSYKMKRFLWKRLLGCLWYWMHSIIVCKTSWNQLADLSSHVGYECLTLLYISDCLLYVHLVLGRLLVDPCRLRCCAESESGACLCCLCWSFCSLGRCQGSLLLPHHMGYFKSCVCADELKMRYRFNFWVRNSTCMLNKS